MVSHLDRMKYCNNLLPEFVFVIRHINNEFGFGRRHERV